MPMQSDGSDWFSGNWKWMHQLPSRVTGSDFVQVPTFIPFLELHPPAHRQPG
jgi:hypothetical protein